MNAELPGRTDTLLILEDRTYRQTIRIDEPPFEHEGGLLQWWIEYGEDGVPRLHLEDMRLCVYFDGVDCTQTGGGLQYWRDFCQDEWIQTPGEGVLMVLGVPEQFAQPPRGFELVALSKHLEGTTYYELQGE